MIVLGDGGYSLRCTGCAAFLELTRGEARDPFLTATRRQSMALLHGECDGFRNVTRARIALKRKRREFAAIAEGVPA